VLTAVRVPPKLPHQAEVLGESGPDEDELVAQIDELVRRPGSLRSVYQPIVDLRRGECVGYEALTRVAEWPAHSPQPWFTAATRSGLAARFEEAALRGALRGRTMMPPGRFLTVNLSAAGLQHEAVVALLLEQPDLHGLVIEITDVPAVLDTPQSLGMLGELRDRGLMAAADIEDGGARELDRIARLRPDVVKLERTLVQGVHADPVRRRVIRSLTGLVAELGAVCLGEGVERREDAHALQDLGIRFGQGWLFGRARPGFLPLNEESASWLASSWSAMAERDRLARLVRRVPTQAQIPTPDGVPLPGHDQPPAGQWWASVSQDGRLLEVHLPDGKTVAGSELVRLRATSDIGAAARRFIAAEGRRSRLGIAAVVDEQGGFLGLVDTAGLLREALAQDLRPGPSDNRDS
jgi:EAL domain-containing protein (putative c-di-GMP-specific phosphodiesterase class I)